ncbi:hypothetical protein BC830DRAFT_1097447 [Chytriomyces sp. MP71]|nr:hypothetical protein BC830DRAFT_1097447 [Chytriomyces sp. MP71]
MATDTIRRFFENTAIPSSIVVLRRTDGLALDVWENPALTSLRRSLPVLNHPAQNRADRTFSFWLHSLASNPKPASCTYREHHDAMRVEWSASALDSGADTLTLALQLTLREVPSSPTWPLAHAGQMGALLAHVDWRAIAPELGDARAWPWSLRAAICVCLLSRIKVALFWGPRLRVLAYNDACMKALGRQHPGVLGKPYEEAFPGKWPFVKQEMEAQMRDGSPHFDRERAWTLDRKGFMELVYHTESRSPIQGDSGKFEGLLTFTFDMTSKVVGESRIFYLQQLGKALKGCFDAKSLWQQLTAFFDSSTDDLDFALIYVPQADGTLVQVGTGTNKPPTLPFQIHPTQSYEDELTASVCKAWFTADHVEFLPNESHQEHMNGMVVTMPIITEKEDIPALLIAGTRKLLPFNQQYENFLKMIVHEISMAFVNAQSNELASAIRSHLEEDIKTQKQISAQTMKRYEQISRVSPVGLFTCDITGVFLFANDKFTQIFGYENLEEMFPVREYPSLGDRRLSADWIHPEDIERVAAAREDCFQSGMSIENLEFRIRPPKLRKTIWLQMTGIFDLDVNGELVVVGCVTDITTRKVLEEERITTLEAEQESQKQRADEAIQSKAESDKFIDMVCHELRNPLNGIMNSNALMKDILDDLSTAAAHEKMMSASRIEQILAKCRECIQAVEICSKHQQSIADDVLNISKLNMNLITISTTTRFNPKVMTQKILSTFQAEMNAKQITMLIKVEDSYQADFINADFLGDPSRITQIIINIVANAIKFTQKGVKKEIHIGLDAKELDPNEGRTSATSMINESAVASQEDIRDIKKGKAILTFAIADTGIGMTANELSLLFKQFQQTTNKTYAEYGGSGLGLFITKRLIDMMNGTISVDSEKGVGTTFTVALPLSFRLKAVSKENIHEAVTQIMPQPLKPRNPSIKRTTSTLDELMILVVDDNDINRTVLQKHLAKLGYESMMAANGQEAYELYEIHERRIMLILMDLEMPVLNGREATIKIRQLEKERNAKFTVPIIAVTGNARSEQVNEARNCGMTDVLLKPFTRDQLAAIITPSVNKFYLQISEAPPIPPLPTKSNTA